MRLSHRPRNPFARPNRERHGLKPRPAIALAAILALFPFVTLALFQQLGPDAPSPASGHAQVIANGVSAMPAQTLAWRVVEDTAESQEQSVAQERALGFALANQQAILIHDQSFNMQTRLAAGEASFVAAGAVQQRSSLAGLPAQYYRIALVPIEQAREAGGDTLVFAGDSFTAPGGDQFDLDLVRDVIRPNESTTIPEGNGPSLVLATDGMIDVSVDGSAPVRLEAGEAANFLGELSISGVGIEPATFVAAVIGPEVPPPPAPPTGSITINVLGCPPGQTAAGAVAAGFSQDAVGNCQRVALAADPLLILAGNQPLAPDQPNPDQGSYTWNFLLHSPFPVADFEIPNQYDAYLLVDATGIIKASDDSGVSPTVADPDVMWVGAQQPDAVATLFLFAEDEPGGSLSLAPFTCPDGMTEDTFASAQCVSSTGLFQIELTEIATGVTRSIAEAEMTPGNPFYTWSDLAPGEYRITVPAMADDRTVFSIPGLDPDPASGSFVVNLTEETPDAQYNLFFLQGESNDDPATSGTVSVSVFNCPPGMTRENLVTGSCLPATGFDLNLYPPTGGALGLSAAEVAGNVVTWSDLPFGVYAVEEVVLPPGYADGFAPGVTVSSLSPRVYVATVEAANARAAIAIYNLEGPPPTPGVDSPGDD